MLLRTPTRHLYLRKTNRKGSIKKQGKTVFQKTAIAFLVNALCFQLSIAETLLPANFPDQFPKSNGISSIVLSPNDATGIEIEHISYVANASAANSDRWIVFFKDPHFDTLSAGWDQWNPYEPEFTERTTLTVNASSSNFNTDQAQLFKDRYSIFGAFYDGDKGALRSSALNRGNPKIDAINQYFSDRSVVLVLGNAGASYNYFVSDIYGANNDFAGTVQGAWAGNTEPVFHTDNNRIKVELGKNILNFERIKGAKGVTWRDQSSDNNTKPLTEASSNLVYIKGDKIENVKTLNFAKSEDLANLIASERKYVANEPLLTQVDIDFYLKPSIMGGDALKVENNVVYLENVITKGIDRKFGIVGGRAQDGTNVNPGTDGGADSIGNLVVIQNSAIGMINTTSNEQTTNTLPGTNIYGGLGYAIAKDNKVLISDSIIQGNVQGGVSMDTNFLGYEVKPYTFNQILAKFNSDFYKTNQTNEVYLDSSRLIGKSSVYASSGAVIFKQTLVDGTWCTAFMDAEIVNFRSGTVYLNGENQSSSVFASDVVFGEKYITVPPEKFFDGGSNGSLTLVLDKENSKPITLGHSLGETYVRTASGFHSVLSRQTPNQSNVTNEKHNFWTNGIVKLGEGSIKQEAGKGSVITLENSFDASGTCLDTSVPIFDHSENKKGTILQPEDHKFSLLAQDNLGGENLIRGTRTYLGISSGYVLNDNMEIQEGEGQVRALNLNWSRILKYRASYASGGRYTIDADAESKINEFVEHYGQETQGSFASVLLPFPELAIKVGQNQTEAVKKYVWIGTKDGEEVWYKNKKDYESGKNGLIAPEDKVEWLQGQYDEVHTVIAPLEQDGKIVAKGTYSVGSYLDFGNLHIVDEKDGRVPDFNDHVFSLNPILEGSVETFVNTDDEIANGNFSDGRQYYIYKSKKNPDTVLYLCIQDKKGVRTYYEEVASTGDIVSITNIDANKPGQEGGISLISLLTKVDVNPGETLKLYGIDSNGLDENGDPKDEKINKSSFTAEMLISGDGGIFIPGKDDDAPKGYTVRFDRSQQKTEDLEKNTYKGQTVVGEGSTLDLWSNYALGETSSAVLGSEATINLYGTDKTQFVASFVANPNSDVVFNNNGTGTLEIGNGGDAGTLGRISGRGTVIINASSLELAGDYSNGEPTVSGSIQLKKNSKVLTDSTKLGWKQIGTSDIKLGDGSVLTINYDSGKENLQGGYADRTLSGTGTFAVVNAEGSKIEEFIFPDTQKNLVADPFTGTLDLTRVNIDLYSGANNANLQQMTLVANDGATAKVGKTQIYTGNITLAGGTLDYSDVTNSYGTHEVTNVLNQEGDVGKTFNFEEGNVQVDLSGNVPKYDGNSFKNVPLLDQDNAKIDIYLGYGKVEGSFGSVTINGKKILDGTRVKAVYDQGEANLYYGIGLTDGKAEPGAHQG